MRDVGESYTVNDRQSWAGFSREEAARREEDLRRFVREPWLDSFDREFYAEFGRWPSGSRLAGTTPPGDERRRAAIQALIDRGSTEGERAAARAALHRLDAAAELAVDALELDDAIDLADEEDLAEWLDERHEAAGGLEDDEDDDDFGPL